MPTLLLRCVAPLQSWGTQSDYSIRDTGRDPSKSGIIGLLCAALGRPRDAELHDLAGLRMGVRVDQEGIVWREWQTALRAPGENANISRRYYLSDAAFLVGLESEDLAWLTKLHRALREPVWHLFLGRKSCPPALPPYLKDGLREEDLRAALAGYPWLGYRRSEYDRLERLRVVLDDPAGAEIRSDLPVSFADRTFRLRRVHTDFIDKPPFRVLDSSAASADVPEEVVCTYRV